MMVLDPAAQAIADAMAQLPQLDLTTLTAMQLRAGMAAFPHPAALDLPLAQVSGHVIPGPAASLPVRIYRPMGSGPHPVTVFFHGGGFVMLGLDSHDNLCRALAAQAGTLVVSVDYRLAPEHRWPAAAQDACAAVGWALREAAALGGDPARVAVAGDSAGGNLAAVAAQHWRARLTHQLLMYPVLDSACDTPSHLAGEHTPMLTSSMMRWFWQQYLGDASGNDPTASPLRQPALADVPSATVIVAGCDPLRDEGQAYAEAMEAAGVPVAWRCWPGQFHGFMSLLVPLSAARDALAYGAERLRAAFASR